MRTQGSCDQSSDSQILLFSFFISTQYLMSSGWMKVVETASTMMQIQSNPIDLFPAEFCNNDADRNHASMQK